MNSLLQRLYPWFHLWKEGWRDLWTRLPWGRSSPALRTPDGQTLAFLRGRWQPATAPATGLLIPPAQTLLRRITLPPLVAAQRLTALHSEVLHASPFDPADTRWGHHGVTLADGRIEYELAIVHARALEPAGAIYAQGAHGPIPLRTLPKQQAAWLTWGLLALLGVLLLAALASPLVYRHQQTLAHTLASTELVKRTAELQQQREKLQNQHQQYQALLGQVDAHAEPLAVLEQLSTVVPDHTYFVQLRLQERQVSVEGQTPNALELLNLLQGTPGLAGVQLAGAVQRHPQTGKDIFQLQMRVQP